MTAPVTLYGIRSCDTMRKARAWLDDHGVAYVFHDYRKDGVPEEHLKRWVDQLGWKALLNQSGTTFRRLPQEKKGSLTAEKAMTLMLEQPAMIRRPVLERPGAAPITGFKPELYERIFASGV
ncbi:ArsC family reductase [Gluconobacter morbifer]|nr:ArsC family reductase [Gluconobacter morbifer]